MNNEAPDSIESAQIPVQIKARWTPFETTLEWHDHASMRVDATGRWCSFHRGQDHYRRTIDGRVVAYRRFEAEAIGDGAAHAIHDTVGAVLARVADLVGQGPEVMLLHGVGASHAAVLDVLERSRSWPPERLMAERDAFARAYLEPISILPPDRYRDVVVQPATGCPSGRCTFCAFYRGQSFSPVPADAFRDHLSRVHALFGPALGGRDGVFLGSASAGSLPQGRLCQVLQQVHAAFGAKRRGVAAFFDPDHAPRRTASDFEALRQAGLMQVVIGLETGLPGLRKAIGKSDRLDALRHTVGTIKQGGIRVCLTVLLGVGGSSFADDHRQATIDWLSQAPLDAADLVYLSPLRVELSHEAARQEISRFRQELKTRIPAKTLPYHMDGFFYYA